MARRSWIAAWSLLLAANALPAPIPAQSAQAAVSNDRNASSLLGSFSLSSSKAPISVDADKLEFSYKDRILTYTGNVSVTQEDLTVRSDKLTVTFSGDSAKPEELKQIVAEGNVHITKGKRSASGGKAVFDQKDRTVELSQDAVLLDGPNRITGDRVVVYLDQERSVVEGGNQRVKAVIYPDKGLAGDTLGEGHAHE